MPAVDLWLRCLPLPGEAQGFFAPLPRAAAARLRAAAGETGVGGTSRCRRSRGAGGGRRFFTVRGRVRGRPGAEAVRHSRRQHALLSALHR